MANKKSKKNIRKTKLKKTHINNNRHKRKLITRNNLVKQKSSRGTRKISNVLSGGDYRTKIHNGLGYLGRGLYNIGRGIGRGIGHRFFLLCKEILGLLIFLAAMFTTTLLMSTLICCEVVLVALFLVPSISEDFYYDRALPIHDDLVFALLQFDPWDKADNLWERLEYWEDPFFKKGGNTYKGGRPKPMLIPSLLNNIKQLEDKLGKPLSTTLREMVLQQVVTNPKEVSFTLGKLIHGNGSEVTVSDVQQKLRENSNGRVISSTTMDIVSEVFPTIQVIIQKESNKNESKLDSSNKINKVNTYLSLLIASLHIEKYPKKQTAQEKASFVKFFSKKNVKILTTNLDFKDMKVDNAEASKINNVLTGEEFKDLIESSLTDGGPDGGPGEGPDEGLDEGPYRSLDEDPDGSTEGDSTSIQLKDFAVYPQFEQID